MGRFILKNETNHFRNNLLLLFFLCASMMVCGMNAHAATILVGPGERVKSIKQALVQAEPFDTIRVQQGHYKEGNIIIDKPIVLLGEGRPIIDGQKQHEPFSVQASNVTIKGFQINNSGHSAMADIAAIKIYRQQHVVIEDNILDDNFFGIYAQESKYCTIRNNHVRGYGSSELLTGNGIHG